MSLENKHVTVCIIGGGPTGIIYLKELLDAGITSVHIFEAKKTSGGLFRGCYEDSMLTISNSFITFSKMHNSDPVHMYCEEYADYCDGFVEKFCLGQYMSFETVATKCTFDKSNKKWTICYNSKRINGSDASNTVTSDYLVVASGAHAPVTPASEGLPACNKLPGTNGLPSFSNFEGTVMHSSEYKESTIFEGKRVLVVGSGESASDIAMAAARTNSKSVAVSVRGVPGHITPRGLGKAYPSETRKIQSGNGSSWQKNLPVGPGVGPADIGLLRMQKMGAPRSQFLPGFVTPHVAAAFTAFLPDEFTPMKTLIRMMGTNMICGLSANNQYGTKTGGLAQALEDGASLVPAIKDIKPQAIAFADGSELDIDLVVLCTGFQTTFPFLKDEGPRAIQDFNPRKLWKHMIHPEYRDKLVFAGFARPAFGSIPQLSEMQARVYAQLVAGTMLLPQEKALVQTIAKDAAQEEGFFISSKYMPALTHFLHYSADLASLIGKNIDYRRLLLREPKLFVRLVTSPFNVMRFYIDDDDKALRHDARNRFAGGHKGNLTKTDLHIWLVCFAITTLIDVPMLSLAGVMPPTRDQRLWAWLTLPFWWVLLIPSMYEYCVLWVFALMSPYTWLYLYNTHIRASENRAGDMCWAISTVDNWYIQNFLLNPFSIIAFLVYVVASVPILIAQGLLMKWAFKGEC